MADAPASIGSGTASMNRSTRPLINFAMLRNYLRIAVRNLTKYKFISFINLFGLTVGITCCLLILTYILHETSYDRYNNKADRIWRVTRSFNNADGIVSLHLGTVAP